MSAPQCPVDLDRRSGTPVPAGSRRGGDLEVILSMECYFHSQSLLFVFPSASASYSKTVATVFRRWNFWDAL